jgi:PrsW family intramembrane metalloprotease
MIVRITYDSPVTTEVADTRYRTGKPGYVREWDGHAWIGAPVPDQTVDVLPKRGVRNWRTHSWILFVLAGWIVGVVLALVAFTGDKPMTWLLAIAGFFAAGGTLVAAARIVWDRLHLADVVDLRRILPLGLLSGFVALGLAFGLEKLQMLIPGPIGSHVGSLFGAGPIEETAKLLVPVLLFFFMGGDLRDPRIGFALVFTSGLVFGIAEGAEYVAGATHLAHDHHLHEQMSAEETERIDAVAMVFVRSFIELMHPFTVSAVAAVAWLAAWRGQGFFSRAAVITYVLAIVYHSFNDGVLGGLITEHQAILGSALSFPLLMLWFYVMYQPRARQLAPPSAVLDNPRRWRPH